jgi:NAD(P)-dependent dehydrogenase (short-subunit alcohol dehydrogenase family)
VDSFAGKLAVVTGGGSGMGRELARQLAAAGCSVAACDWHADTIAETAAMAQAGAGPGVLVTGHACDVSDEAQVLRFRDELLAEHASDHVDLVFSNAGIGGGGSFVNDSREDWERTFAIDWWGVYYCARAFLPLLIASGDGVLVNTSSVNGIWASLGPGRPNTAYSAAKFAVRGFSEALIEDLRSNAPQVRVAVVMPGHVGTDIVANSMRAHGREPERMTDAEVEEMIPPGARTGLIRAGALPEDASADDLRQFLIRAGNDFRDKAPVSAAQAATVILDGVRTGTWRILVGKDAKMIDTAVRAKPEAAYDYAALFGGRPKALLRRNRGMAVGPGLRPRPRGRRRRPMRRPAIAPPAAARATMPGWPPRPGRRKGRPRRPRR